MNLTETELSTRSTTDTIARVFIASAAIFGTFSIAAAVALRFAPAEQSGPATQRTLARQLHTTSLNPKIDSSLGRLLYRASQVATSTTLASTGSTPINTTPDTITPSSLIDVFITTGPEVNHASIEALGIDIRTVAGEMLTAAVPAQAVSALLNVDGVEKVTAASVVEFQTNVSIPETNANDVWDGLPPNFPATGNTGKGVVVGIVDSGIDYKHADFITANNTSRILYVWDQQWSGIPPTGFGYGVQYTNTELTDQTDQTATDFLDTDGHGTSVAGIAAGNGRATGNSQAAYRYVGVAPEADLIVVKAYKLETQVVDAVNYVFQRAGPKPAVVNLSLGLTKGAHDGTYAFDKSLSNLTGPGKIIATAAGNDGLTLLHASTNLATGGAQADLTMNIPTYTPSQSQTEYVIAEGWHGASSAFDVKLVAPNGTEVTSWVAPNTTTGYVETTQGTILVMNDQATNGEVSTSPRYAKQIMVTVAYGTPGTARPAIGDWKISLRRRSGATVTTGLSDWWITQYFFVSGTNRPLFKGIGADSEKTLLSPATGDTIIATGAYGTKYSWTNAVGSVARYLNTSLNSVEYKKGRVADFSSRGARRDGLIRPDVVAPGYGVMAAKSANAVISSTYTDPDGKHAMFKGTSQASAHTAGVIALFLQQFPNLCPDALGPQPNGQICDAGSSVRRLLTSRATADVLSSTQPCPQAAAGTCPLSAMTGPVVTQSIPNQFYGYGKLSVIPTKGSGEPEPPIKTPVR